MGSQMNTREKQNTGTYIEGSTVRKLNQYGQAVPKEVPERRIATPERKREVRPANRPTSAARRRARRKALQMNLGYVGFLSIAAVASLFICVNYLRLQYEVTKAGKELTSMESSYSELKLANDAAEARAVSSVDLDEIRDIAINELGMVYANRDQIVTYEKQDKDFVRQYKEVPKE